MLILTGLVFFFAMMSIVGGSLGILIYSGHFNMSTLWLNTGATLYSIYYIFIQIYVSYVSDRLKSKSLGRRKPLIIASYFIYAALVLILSFPPKAATANPRILAGYYVTFYPLMAIPTAMFYSPLGALLVETCADPEDFSRVGALSQVVGGVFGSVLGGLMTNFLYSSAPWLTPVVAIVFAAVYLVLFVLYLPSNICRKVDPQPPLIPSFRLCIRTKEFATLWTNEVLISIAYNVAAGLTNVFLIVNGSIKNNSQLVFFVIVSFIGTNVLATLTTVITVSYTIIKFDKLKVYLRLTQSAVVVGFVGFFVTLVNGSSVPILVYFIVVAMIIVPMLSIESIMLRDLISYDTFITGINRESMYSVSFSVPASVVGQFFGSIPSIILYNTGYATLTTDSANTADNYKWNEGTIWQCRVYMSFLFSILAAASYFVIFQYPMNSDVAKKISAAVEKRTLKKVNLENEAESYGRDIDNEDFRAALETDELVGSFSNNEAEMQLQHFSKGEIVAIAKDGHKGLTSLSWFILGGLIAGIISTLLLLSSLALLIKSADSRYVTIITSLMLISSMYTLYEGLRYAVVLQLLKQSDDAISLNAAAAHRKNQTYQESLQSLLDRNGIDEDGNVQGKENIAEEGSNSNQVRNSLAKHASAKASNFDEDFRNTFMLTYSVMLVSIIVSIVILQING